MAWSLTKMIYVGETRTVVTRFRHAMDPGAVVRDGTMTGNETYLQSAIEGGEKGVEIEVETEVRTEVGHITEAEEGIMTGGDFGKLGFQIPVFLIHDTPASKSIIGVMLKVTLLGVCYRGCHLHARSTNILETYEVFRSSLLNCTIP